MKQSKRVLAFLMAVALLATTLAFSASAKVTLPDKIDSPGVEYDQTSKIILTTDLYASMVLDELDDLLKQQNIYLNLGSLLPASILSFMPGLGNVSLDMRSIDALCKSLKEFQPALVTVYDLVPALSKDASTNYTTPNGGLNLYYLQQDSCRRSYKANGGNDIFVLRQIFNVLADPNPQTNGGYMPTRSRKNAEVLGGLIQDLMTPGGLNKALGPLGPILGSLIPGGLDVNKLLKGLLVDLVYKKDDPHYPPDPTVLTLDSMVQALLGTLDLKIKIDDKNEIDLGKILALIDLQTDTVYELIDKILEPAYTQIVVPLLNGMLKDLLKDAAESAGFGDYVDINFDPPKWVDLGIDSTHTLFDQLNVILGKFIEAVITYNFGANSWVMGDNSNLVPNIIKVGKVLIEEFGNDIFPGVVFKPDTEIDAMGEMTFVAYLAKTIINELMTYVYIPDAIGGTQIDTLTKVLNVVLIEQAGDTIPEMYGTYVNNYYGANAATSLDKLATSLELLSDYLVKLLFFKVDTNVLTGYDRSAIDGSTTTKKAIATSGGTNSLRYVDSFDVVIGKLFNWIVGNYGGVINPIYFPAGKSTINDAWELLSNIIFGLLDPSILGVDYSLPGTGLKKLLIGDLIGPLFGSSDVQSLGVTSSGVAGQIKIDGLLNIFKKNPTGVLNHKVAKFLIDFLLDVLDAILGRSAKGGPYNVSTTAMRGDYQCLEDILSKTAHLGTLLGNLLMRLGEAGDRLIATAMPLAVEFLPNAMKMAEYRPPAIGLERITRYVPTIEFNIENDSGGLPAMNYDRGQVKKQEEGYTYTLTGATANYVGNTGDAPVTLSIVNVNTGNPLGTGANIVTLDAGQSVKLRLTLPMGAVDKLVTVSVTYSVKAGSSGEITPANGLTTRVYTFVTDKFKSEGGTYVPDFNGDKAPVTDTGGTYWTGGSSGNPCGVDQGYANTISYSEYHFFNQHDTVAKFLEKMSVNISRFNDVGTFDPATGNPLLPPEHVEESFVMLDPLYYYYGNGDAQSGWASPSAGTLQDPALLVFTIKDPVASMVKTENNKGGTLNPFTLWDFVAGDEIEVDGKMVPILEAPITSILDIYGMDATGALNFTLLSDRTSNKKAGIEPLAGADQWESWSLDDRYTANANAQCFSVILYYHIENDYDLAGLVNEIIGNDEQRGRYVDDSEVPNTTANFNKFMEHISRAAWIVFKPKDQSLISTEAGSLNREINEDLDKLVIKEGSTTQNLENMLQIIYGLKDNAYIEAGEKVYLDYWDPRYTYFAESDFIPAGYQKARAAISEAEKLIARVGTENPPTAMEINYCESLLKKTCDARLIRSSYYPYPNNNNNDFPWKLLPTASFEHSMEYHRAWLEDPLNYLPGTGVTFAELKTAFYDTATAASVAPYDYTGDYTAGGADLDGDSVRKLMRAYDNVLEVEKSWLVNPTNMTTQAPGYCKNYHLGTGTPAGASTPFSAEFQSDRAQFERIYYPGSMGLIDGFKRIPQSQLTRARDELVYAYKHIVASKGDAGIEWKNLDAINKKLTQDKVVTEGNKTLNELFTDYAGYFVPSYKATYDELYSEMADLLANVKGKDEENYMLANPTYQAIIDDLAANLTKASMLMVAVVPNEDSYVFNKNGLRSGVYVDLSYYERIAYAAQNRDSTLPNPERMSVKDFLDLDDGYVLLDNLTDDTYEGYIYGLDLTKPTLIAVPAAKNGPWAAPYRVINGFADAPELNSSTNKYLTGATVQIRDSKNQPIFKLKSVYFGDSNGNGTLMETSEISDLGMVINQIRWQVPGSDRIYAGEYAPATMAMDVYTSNGTLNQNDFDAFKTAGTRYVDQAGYRPDAASGENLVIKGKPVSPPAN